MRPFKRRNFLTFLSTLPIAGIATFCREKPKTQVNLPGQLVKNDKAMKLSKSMSTEQLHAMLDQRASQVMQKSHNCAQSTFYVLSEQFGLGGDEVLKALTPLPGMAERGETCGAITGALMAMGMIYGRDRLDDWEKYRKALVPTNKFCGQFQEALGSTLCCQIQERAFGRSFNLMDPEQLRAFQRAGATDRCTKVVQKACRLAADIIVASEA
jgi:C_GCAxxG_C_C family probable redox protein